MLEGIQRRRVKAVVKANGQNCTESRESFGCGVERRWNVPWRKVTWQVRSPFARTHVRAIQHTHERRGCEYNCVCVCVYTPMTTNRFSPEQVSVPIFGPPSLSKVLKLRPSQSLTFRSLLLSLNPHLDRERRSYWTWVIKTRGLCFFSLWWFLFVLSFLFFLFAFELLAQYLEFFLSDYS